MAKSWDKAMRRYEDAQSERDKSLKLARALHERKQAKLKAERDARLKAMEGSTEYGHGA